MDTKNTASEKPTLSHVIAAIVSSVAHARGAADAEALRIAARYRSSELLKGLPVPRLRLRNVNISLPVIVSSVDVETLATLNTPERIAAAASDAFAKSLETLDHQFGISSRMDSLSEQEQRRAKRVSIVASEFVSSLRRASVASPVVSSSDDFLVTYSHRLTRAIQSATRNVGASDPTALFTEVELRGTIGELAADIAWDCFSENVFIIIKKHVEQRIAADASSATPKPASLHPFDPERARLTIERLKNDDDIAIILDNVRQAAASTTYATTSTPPQLRVIVDTDNIKNAGGGVDVVTRFNMTLHEEGLEWSSDTQTGADRLGIE